MPLSTPDITALSRLLDEAEAIAPGDRDTWLAGLPADQAHLAGLLREMLAERDHSAGLLGTLPKLGGSEPAVASAGERVGPYRLLHEIGRGGMGSVWLAERADGSFERQVALKLPRLAWSEGLAERMARERRIGALLEHPAIARLYDAGLDERGRPYIAMEYIAGQPIDAWCREQALDAKAKLKLFVQVIRAVAYAHGRLVIHRDLKPANILVDAQGQAHLLDFGIAKLMSDQPADGALTQETGRVMTPHYAAPEQIEGRPVGVAADVYALGVTLYELLTGQRPFAARRHTLGAIEDAVLQGDAPLASRVAPDAATRRALAGEVDAILHQAMQRAPERRYGTAEALAQDIERHLQGETVSARPDSWAYRTRKALRRHWVGVSAVSAVLVAVLAGSSVAVVQARRAAEEAERARVVKDFVTEVFRVNTGTDAQSAQARQLPAEQLLARGAKLIDSRFPQQPAMRAEMLGVVGGIYAQMGAFRLAADFTKRQLDVLERLNAERGERVGVILRLAEAMLNDRATVAAQKYVEDALRLADGDGPLSYDALVMLLRCQAQAGQLEAARMTLRRAQQLEQQVDVSGHVSRAWAQAAQAELLANQNHAEEAIAAYDQAIGYAGRTQGTGGLAATEIRLRAAYHLMSLNRWGEARARYEPALSALRALGQAGETRALVQEVLNETMLAMYGRQPAVSTADRIGRLLATLQQPDRLVPAEILADVEWNLTRVELMGGSVENAQARVDRGAATAQEPGNEPALLSWLGIAGRTAVLTGHYADAETYARRAVALRVRTGAGGAQFSIVDHVGVVYLLLAQQRFDEAEAYIDTVPHIEPVAGDPLAGDYYADALMEARARVRVSRGDVVGALQVMGAKADRLIEADDGSWSPAQNWNVTCGLLWCQMGQFDRGLATLDKAAALRMAYAFAHDPGLAQLRAQTGLCALQAGHRAEAQRLAALAREAFVRQPGVSDFYKAPLAELERQLAAARAAVPPAPQRRGRVVISSL
ncbi:protein kinase domain-containing protein [Aquabacterium sp.]|uniref:serine/threonine-protein kinase n=1 Tax=Aquabacterium sp. TaxID=1872578 RepID=UPI003782F14B